MTNIKFCLYTLQLCINVGVEGIMSVLIWLPPRLCRLLCVSLLPP